MALSEAEELELLELEEQEAAGSQPAPSGGSSQMDVAGFALGQAAQLAPWNRVNDAFKSGVGRVAEFAGSKGANPYLTAAALTPVAMAPEILAATSGWKGVQNTSNPTLKGLTSTPQELGPQYAAQNAAIGVERRIPQEGGRLPTYPQPELQGLGSRQPRPLPGGAPSYLPEVVPERLPSKPGDFLKYGNEKLSQFGDRMNPQELMDWDVKLGTDLSNPNVIPRFQVDPMTGKQTSKITTMFQQASDLSARAKGTFNQIAEERLKAAQLPEGTMPTRAALDQAYALSNRVQQYYDRGLAFSWKVGKAGAKWATAGAVGAAGGYGAYRAMQ